MTHKKIEITPQEIEEIKDTVAFRTKLLYFMKQLEDMPIKVTVLETKVAGNARVLGVLLLSILGIAAWAIKNIG